MSEQLSFEPLTPTSFLARSAVVHVRDELPRTATGKVQKYVLREQLLTSQIER